MLALASLTQPLVDFATNLIGSAGYGGVLLLMTITGVVGLPGTEPTMLFAGFDVYNHTLTLFGIILAGVAGDVLGASIAYAIGYYAERELLERQGSRFHVSQKKLDRAHSWFERYGAPVIVVSRCIPFARAAFPYAAGASRMPYTRFLPLAALGSLGWVSGLAVLGREVGSNWTNWRHHLEYVDYVGAAVLVAAIVYLIVRRNRPDRDEPSVDAPAVDAVSK